ncbi:MAG: helicase, partial [Chloroflexi bacterium]|nr:helicase [Chloroflexota bacterium]
MDQLNPPGDEAFIGWMLESVVAEARGDHMQMLSVAPSGRLWLGRLAPEVVVQESRLGERSERLEPCEVGVRLRLSEVDGRMVRCTGRFVVWSEFDGGDDPDSPRWRKSDPIEVTTELTTPRAIGTINAAGCDDFAAALAAIGADGMACEFHAELEFGKEGPEVLVTLVNCSPAELPHWDTNVYQASLIVDAGPTLPFTLDNLPDSFRYDRRVAAYGVNGGVEKVNETTHRTTDVAVHDQPRPTYWDDGVGTAPNITFAGLADDPIPALRDLVNACERWSGEHWAPAVLDHRAKEEAWDGGMRSRADEEASVSLEEIARLRRGLNLLEANEELRWSFQLANQAFARSPLVRHKQWRPFQLGFLLANVASIVDETRDGDRRIVDTLWFATGG